MNEQPQDPRERELESGLQALFGPAPRIAEARLQRVRRGVFTRLEQQALLPRWLRWQLALPAAASLLLLGAALGWNVEPRLTQPQPLDLFGSVLMGAPGDLE